MRVKEWPACDEDRRVVVVVLLLLQNAVGRYRYAGREMGTCHCLSWSYKMPIYAQTNAVEQRKSSSTHTHTHTQHAACRSKCERENEATKSPARMRSTKRKTTPAGHKTLNF